MSPARLTRRELFENSALAMAGAAAAGTFTAASRARAATANDRLVIGLMGTGGRGQWLLREELTTKWPDVDVAYLCDADTQRLDAAMAIVEKAGRRPPRPVKDFRAILDDQDVDALFVATPDHWHALPTILACQAGKDVFLEKPASHDAWEGRKIVEAARKYQRVVQLGTQTRSGPYTHEAVEFLRAGRIGEIHMVRVYNMVRRPPIDPQPDGPAPDGVDYDLWTGPAPLRPFNPNRFHYHWHWCWDFSGGDIINDGVHQIDAARMLIGRDYPKAVTCTGGKLAYQDASETPDTQLAVWEFDNLMMVFELALWAPHMQKTPWDYRDTDGFPNWQFNATKVEVHGTKGLMYFSRHGGGWQAWNPDGKEIANAPGRHPHHPHLANFFDCVRTRRRPNADIEEGHRSTLLCQIANISYRLDGRRLAFDGGTETFANDREANAMLKRPARPPWIIPDEV